MVSKKQILLYQRAWTVSYTHLDVYKRQILYRYGVYVMIPYMMMIGINLIKTWKSFNKGERGGLLIVLITVSVCMRLLIENVEYAFLGLDWFLLYLSLIHI